MNFIDNKEKAEEVARNRYGNDTDIKIITIGYDNLIVIIDKKWTLRFPRDENALKRNQYETQILNELKIQKDVEVPVFIDESLNPPYFVTKYIHGNNLDSNKINTFSLEQQQNIGKQIALFAYTLHLNLKMEVVDRLRKEYGLDEAEDTWCKTYNKMLAETKFPTSIQDNLTKKYFQLWKIKAEKSPSIAVHDDLHLDNLLFEGNSLVGVLDFGDTNIGTPEQEFRQLYRINEVILKSAVDAYAELSGKKIDIETTKIWAIVQEMSTYSERLEQKNHPSYIRARKNLQRWIPEGEW
jgi:aminoglycoside phosphotransferase (APT) family kinase protein